MFTKIDDVYRLPVFISRKVTEQEAVNSATWVGYLGIRTKTRRPLKQIYKPTEQNRSIHWRRRI